MQDLPEFIKYRGQCAFALGISLMTPLLTLILKVLTFDSMIINDYHILIVICDFVLAELGFHIIRWNHRYLMEKEYEYARMANK